MSEETKPEETKTKPKRDKPKPKVARPEKVDRLTPMGWARRKGQARTLKKSNGERVVLPTPQHMAAAQLHGWNDHRHHAGSDDAMVEEDYEAAIKAAMRPVKCTDGRSRYVPHDAACSKYAAYKKAKNVPGPKKEG